MCKHARMTQRRAVTIQDVARTAGVSTATVSRVLNGASTVDASLAERVRRAAAETRYVPNTTGRALRRQVSDIWAAVVSDVQNPFFTTMVAALQSVAESAGVAVVLCNTDEQLARERSYLQAAVAQRMSGVVVAVASERDSDLSPVLNAQIPVVVVDRRLQGYTGDAVLVDNASCGRLAAEHLLEQGFRRIACIAGPSDVSTTEDRLDGFRAALAAAGTPLAEHYTRRANLRPEGGQEAMVALMSMPEPPDAVFATNGPLTVGAYLASQELGREIPDDVALVGVDDDQWTRIVSPRVTVVQQPVAEIGRLAGEVLARHSRDGSRQPEQLVLAPTLLVRESSTRSPS